MQVTGSQLQRYGVAVVAVAIAFGIASLTALLPSLRLNSLSELNYPFLMFFAAVMVSAWYGGKGPGILATALAAIACFYLLLSGTDSIFSPSLGQDLQLGLFVVEGLLLSSTIAGLQSARKQAQVRLQKLQESDDLLRQLTENISQVFWVSSGDKKQILYVSPAYEEIWGRSRESLYQQPQSFRDTIHPQDRDRVVAAFPKQVPGANEQEYRIVQPDGTIRWIRDRAFGVKNEKGEIYRIIGIAEDLTERKQIETELQKSEERFRTSVDNMLDCFGIYSAIRDESGQIVDFITEYVNTAASTNNLMTKEEQIGNKLCELLPAHRESGLFDEYCKVVETGEPLIKESLIYEDVYNKKRLKKAFDIRVSKLGDGFVATWREITERKQAEEELKEQKEILQIIQDNIPVLIDFYDSAGNIVYINSEWERVYGWSQEMLNNRGSDEFFSSIFPDPEYRQTVYEYMAGSSPGWHDFQVQFEDGLQEQSWANVRLSNGMTVGIGLDISHRKQADEALRESEERFRNFFEEAPIGIAVVDLEGRFLKVNKTYCEMLGYSEEELTKLTFVDITHPEDVEKDLRHIEQVFTGKMAKYQIQKRYIKKNGEILWVHLTATGIGDRDGKVSYSLGMVEDITERKAAQEALRQSEARFKRLVEFNMIGVIFWDASGNITDANDAFLAMVGYTREDLLSGKVCWKNMTPPEQLYLSEKAIAQMKQRGAADPLEKEYIRKDGSRVPILLGGVMFEKSQDRGVSYVLDLTERKAAEEERNQLLIREREAREEAEAASRSKDEFLAIVSHELRSPLNAMLGWSRLLRTRSFDQSVTNRALEAIERNAMAQAQLIEDLLDISRMIRGKLSLKMRNINLVCVIEAAMDTVRPASEAKNISIECDFDPSVGLVSGDGDRLQQVVWNLLSNAIKFTPEGGRVTVKLSKVISQKSLANDSELMTNDSYAQIQVIDTGKGISAEFLPFVFERFRQADSTSTRSQSGLGLGLAIVRNLVELHGGTVQVESQGQGQGSTFTVLLPLLEPGIRDWELGAGKDSSPFPNSPSPISLAGLQVLIVDDSADTREFMTAALEESGAAVTAAASAEQALQLLERFQPDVLLSDIAMPEDDGYALIRKIRALESAQGRQIPAAALTAYARDEDRKQALLAGFQMHVSKPIEPANLVALVAKLAGRNTKESFDF